MVKRRKFLIGMGALAAGSATAMGTGAFEGAYVHGDRDLNLSVTNDSNGYLRLIDTSQYASYSTVNGGVEHGAEELQIDLTRLNPNADTRLDDVFRVQNTTGAKVDLKIGDEDTHGGFYEDTFQIWAQPTGDDPVRIDAGDSIELEAGEEVEINLVVLLQSGPNSGRPNGLPSQVSVTADGTDSDS